SDAVKVMIDELINNKIIKNMDEIKGIGHRVLHGGELYSDSVVITDKVLDDIINLTNLGPLHHPGEIAGIKAMKEYLPDTLQVAVFDTAFHQTMPDFNYIYAVPYEWYTKYKVRRYGFHGTSHKYITSKMQEVLNKKDVNLIICHVGSGASVTCVKDGKSYDTSMGLTPLDGLVMGTRSGGIDPSIIKFVCDEGNMQLDEVMNELNKNSGLKGICGKNDFRDMRALIDKGDNQAKLAYEIFMDSIIKHIAEYYFELNGKPDAMVFTAGILENNTAIREDIINRLSGPMNIFINKDSNDNIGYGKENKEGIITNKESKLPVYVIPTDEEVMIVRDTYRLIKEA
ncbi:MAG: acetate/propionate family kinase, partial [Bacilli bacterium]|nr:acetate/propionate family kinase [Bacilli bacterium]